MSVEETVKTAPPEACVNLETVNRITQLPIVASTIETATTMYSKVKDYNSVTNWTLSTAETTVHKAVEIGMPIATPVVCRLKEPIQKVDGLLCTGLDYIEEKIPAVKLPPGELFLQMYNGAKGYVTNTVGTGVETAKNTVEAAKHIVEPAVETAKHIIEPAMETAKNIIDPTVEKACAMKDYGLHKVDEILHTYMDKKESVECEDCLTKKETSSQESLSDM